MRIPTAGPSMGLRYLNWLPDEAQLKPEAQYTVFNPSEIEMSDTTNAVLAEVERLQPARVVFDSLSELRLLARDSLRYRRQILGLKQYFSGRKCTVLLLDDRTAEGHDQQLQSIAHGVIMMESVEREYGIKRRRLEVKKLRGSRFREGFHDYSIKRGGVEVYPRLVAAEHLEPFHPIQLQSGIPALDTLAGRRHRQRDQHAAAGSCRLRKIDHRCPLRGLCGRAGRPRGTLCLR